MLNMGDDCYRWYATLCHQKLGYDHCPSMPTFSIALREIIYLIPELHLGASG